jgi:hypothetical protein
MTAIHDPFDLVAGRDWEFSGPLTDADCNPLPLTGAQIVWRLDSLDGTQNFLKISLNAGITITNMACSEIQVAAAAAITAAVPAGPYRDWLTVTLQSGQILDLWSGIIRVAPQPA